MYRNNKIYCRGFQFCLRIGSLFLDWSEPKLLKGENSVLKISDLLKNKNIKSVLLVTDNGLKNLGLIDGLVKKLEDDGIKVAVFSDVQPNPTIENVENAKDYYFANNSILHHLINIIFLLHTFSQKTYNIHYFD